MVVTVTRATVTATRRYAKRMPVEQRREALLDAALVVLARDGYDKVSIEAIAREADVTRPVVYQSYGGLEPLLHALLDRTQQQGLEQAVALLDEAGNPTDVDDWVLAAVGNLIDLVHQHPNVWRPILGLTRGAPAIVRDRIEETREVVRQHIEAGLRTGLEQRGGPDLDTQVLSHIVMVMAEEFGRLVLEDPPRYSKERLLTALTGLLAAAPPPA